MSSSSLWSCSQGLIHDFCFILFIIINIMSCGIESLSLGNVREIKEIR